MDADTCNHFTASYHHLLDGTKGFGMLSTLQSSSVALLAAFPIASVSKAISAPLVEPTSSMPNTSLPVPAAIAGCHVKSELPRSSSFDADIDADIHADSNIRACLLQDYVTISGIDPSMDPSAWLLLPVSSLTGILWHCGRHANTQLCEQPEVLYSWHNFREWCLLSCSVLDHEKYALDKLQSLRQTGTAAAYNAGDIDFFCTLLFSQHIHAFWVQACMRICSVPLVLVSLQTTSDTIHCQFCLSDT